MVAESPSKGCTPLGSACHPLCHRACSAAAAQPLPCKRRRRRPARKLAEKLARRPAKLAGTLAGRSAGRLPATRHSAETAGLDARLASQSGARERLPATPLATWRRSRAAHWKAGPAPSRVGGMAAPRLQKSHRASPSCGRRSNCRIGASTDGVPHDPRQAGCQQRCMHSPLPGSAASSAARSPQKAAPVWRLDGALHPLASRVAAPPPARRRRLAPSADNGASAPPHLGVLLPGRPHLHASLQAAAESPLDWTAPAVPPVSTPRAVLQNHDAARASPRPLVLLPGRPDLSVLFQAAAEYHPGRAAPAVHPGWAALAVPPVATPRAALPIGDDASASPRPLAPLHGHAHRPEAAARAAKEYRHGLAAPAVPPVATPRTVVLVDDNDASASPCLVVPLPGLAPPPGAAARAAAEHFPGRAAPGLSPVAMPRVVQLIDASPLARASPPARLRTTQVRPLQLPTTRSTLPTANGPT